VKDEIKQSQGAGGLGRLECRFRFTEPSRLTQELPPCHTVFLVNLTRQRKPFGIE
jgi:hypothetical protein